MTIVMERLSSRLCKGIKDNEIEVRMNEAHVDVKGENIGTFR